MYEVACEPHGNCNNDQDSFKAYLSRWMAKASIAAPHIKDTVTQLITTSGKAAAESCSGGNNSESCGQKWYVGGYDGSFGVGQSLSALETVQALLLLQGGVPIPQQNNKQDSGSSSVHDVQTKNGKPITTITRTVSATETAACTAKVSCADASSCAEGLSKAQGQRRRDAHLLRHGIAPVEELAFSQ